MTPLDHRLSVPVMVMHLGDRDEQVRHAAIQALLTIPAVDARSRLLAHRTFAVRAAAVAALGHLPKSAENIHAVARLIRSASFEMREAVAKALAEVSVKGDTLAVSALGCLMKDPIREVREAAAASMRRVALPDDPSAVAVVLSCITHDAWPVQSSALQVLADIAPGSPDLLADIAHQVGGGNATLAKITAARVLQAMSEQEEAALKHVGDQWQDEEETPRLARPSSAQQRMSRWADEASDAEEEDEGLGALLRDWQSTA